VGWRVLLRLAHLAANRESGNRAPAAREKDEDYAVTAGHFIFIPAVLIVGIVIGWILGSRAARDAYLMELRRQQKKQL
jgi:hypothetical protein